MRRFLILCALAFFSLGSLAVPAGAGGVDYAKAFDLRLESRDQGRRVLVRFNHPVFGWVDAGYVDFRDDGAILLKIRGEEPRRVSDLGRALGGFSRSRIGDPSVGLNLAQSIAQRAGVAR